ncbi:MAG: phosphoribosyl-ATP diphosphatase [Treponema sp.]|jgi:phosphoribosyl-ATP pyrophosphohydrolase/phosphoribosyl-AMP cyclohydrolase|nr:phosphoribosyl-ATP diphosphatase [Treponema sp.]
MVIASIDIQNGKVVQLRQGSELVLQRDNHRELAEEFNRYGETAIIDLDAAMGKGTNIELVKSLLRVAECRVGGGIRTAERARELVSLGARKIIIGSAALRDSRKKGAGKEGGEFLVNAAFLESLVKKIGRERVIVAVDARDGEILVDGWETPTGLDLLETVRAVEPFAGELLFTCVEREGTMTGIDMERVKRLRETVSCAVTVAGGVSALEEIEAIAALGCDVQLGMALYTGKITLADAFIRSLNWKKAMPGTGVPLLPVIAQSPDGQVLMTGFAGPEAIAETFKRGNLCFHSRTRNRLWMKGETSGNTLRLLRLRADCDRDALLAVVEPAGPVCHTGGWSCFGGERRYTWEFLQAIIADRFNNPTPGSYTAALDNSLVREKIMEEAGEVCAAKTHGEVVWEAADLLYFLTVLMTKESVTAAEVLDELDRRHKK